ncbi:MAG: hypothetical protein BECKG1743D_GA0114223_103692 [Candidatus Kentron sp. G]|nr:MAG: hypothetical protein BECKG1743F_GA0114225_101552 [Candidatus Kentron sp. G]VFN00974.1 MAG: hypothetical protein BECKG1743E_GA0114224_103682 [Candidatus Kentron sp. G]VFN02479.1 MAG: hypothetical protein BECKG1743D_GA0114223_103692 [Candidatus Kentron sp. G]
MPQIDKIKEEIGWLKVIFALLGVTDVSLIGWTAQSLGKASTSLLLLAAFTIILVSRRPTENNLPTLLCLLPSLCVAMTGA